MVIMENVDGTEIEVGDIFLDCPKQFTSQQKSESKTSNQSTEVESTLPVDSANQYATPLLRDLRSPDYGAYSTHSSPLHEFSESNLMVDPLTNINDVPS